MAMLHARMPGHRRRAEPEGRRRGRSLNRICAERGPPKTIKTDNGSEFISKVMDKWAYERGVELDFSRTR